MTVNENDTPAVAVLGALTTKLAAAAALTVMLLLVPLMLVLLVSVAVIVQTPLVLRVALKREPDPPHESGGPAAAMRTPPVGQGHPIIIYLQSWVLADSHAIHTAISYPFWAQNALPRVGTLMMRLSIETTPATACVIFSARLCRLPLQVVPPSVTLPLATDTDTPNGAIATPALDA